MAYKNPLHTKVVSNLRGQASDLSHNVRDQAAIAVERTGERISSRPLASVGIAFAAGLAIAALIGAAGMAKHEHDRS